MFLTESRTPSARIGDVALSLPSMVAEAILQDIVEGTLKPGSRLTEGALAKHHAVSRSTIREALAQLERNQFIERVPRYGARVVQVDMAETEALFEIRSSLLALSTNRACRFASDDELEALRDKTAMLERLAANDTTSAIEYSHRVYDLQSYLIELSNSRALMALYEQIADQTVWRAMVRHRGVGFADTQRRRQSARDWRNVADAVSRRDVAASEAASKALVSASMAYISVRFSKGADV